MSRGFLCKIDGLWFWQPRFRKKVNEVYGLMPIDVMAHSDYVYDIDNEELVKNRGTGEHTTDELKFWAWSMGARVDQILPRVPMANSFHVHHAKIADMKCKRESDYRTIYPATASS